MKKICVQCHSTDWANSHFNKIWVTAEETNRMTLEATKLLLYGWENGVAEGLPSNPFDEHIERLWVQQWLYYSASIRHGEAMMGPDYMTFENGWYRLTENLYKMSDIIEDRLNSGTGTTGTDSSIGGVNAGEEVSKPTVEESSPGFEIYSLVTAFIILAAFKRFKGSKR